MFTAKTQREARLNPSETDLPRLSEAQQALPGGLPRTTRGARPHHGAMAYGPVDAGSCFCKAGALGPIGEHPMCPMCRMCPLLFAVTRCLVWFYREDAKGGLETTEYTEYTEIALPACFNARTLALQIRSTRREECDAAHSTPRV